MKNPEEDILKRFLQDTFSDYEPEPSPETWENIHREIQPKIGAGLRQWIIPVVVLLLLVGGIFWTNDNKEDRKELAINSTQKNDLPFNQSDVSSRLKSPVVVSVFTDNRLRKIVSEDTDNNVRQILYVNKTSVNKTTLKVEIQALPKVEKQLEVPVFSALLTEPVTKTNVEDFSVSINEFSGIDDKSVVVSEVNTLDNSLDTDIIKRGNVVREKSPIKKEKAVSVMGKLTNQTPITKAIVEEIRSIKSLETLKNKDFITLKNEMNLPQITKIVINKDPKPVRRHTYMSLSITPIQTYRILTVNHLGVQNLQTNKLFDAERNGWAFELGITKPIGDKWNFRGSISYLKMRQWAEYQINTEKISVKNSNNYSNAVTVGNSDNEFIGQTRIESKTLQMVGLKADVQKFFKVSGRNRYFISGGSQLMVEPTEKQTNVFINASAGFQHLVNKDCFLTIEPTAQYLLNNINDSKSLIQTNAYNLGLKVGVSFKIK